MEESKKTKQKVIQTFASDMAKMIESDTGGGLIKKMIHGEEEKEAEKKNLSPESTKNKLFMLISFSLVVLSLSTIFFFILNDKVSTVDVPPQFVPLIFNDKTTFLSVDGFSKEKIIKTILTEVNTAKVKVGGLDGIYLISNKRLVGLRQFFSLIKSNFLPGDVNFLNDNFLLGVVNNEVERAPFLPPDEDHTGKDFFILMKMRSMPDVFDSFRAWENKMFLDLHEFFRIEISSETAYLLTKDFTPGIVENKNANILYDKNNKIVMMYIFADDNSVIITNTLESAREVMLRLASGDIEK